MSRLYIGGLSYNTEQNGLREAFARFGNVVDAAVVRDRETGRSRGFGFVTFESEPEADAAINGMNQQTLDGRRISVAKASERTGGSPREGGFRGGDRSEGGYRQRGEDNNGGYRQSSGY